MDKRYQVFISSTYADLKEERQRVMQTVMKLDCIPAGMELFPAADEEQFEFIKRVIDDCDYYLVIIGGRYGSTTDEGISYTEKEYDYALSRSLKVIALLHEDPDSIPIGKSEKDSVQRERLNRFREKVRCNRIVDFWKTADQLPGLVALSLSKMIKLFPAVGWVRANRPASEDVLGEINELRKENNHLEILVNELSKSLKPAISDLAGLDEQIELGGRNLKSSGYGTESWSVKATWRQVFAYVSPWLVEYPNQYTVKQVLEKALWKQYGYPGSDPHLDEQDFQTVSVQLKALGLVDTQYSQAVGGSMGLFWSLTPAGEKLMLEVRTVRTKTADDKC